MLSYFQAVIPSLARGWRVWGWRGWGCHTLTVIVLRDSKPGIFIRHSEEIGSKVLANQVKLKFFTKCRK